MFGVPPDGPANMFGDNESVTNDAVSIGGYFGLSGRYIVKVAWAFFGVLKSSL